MIDAAYLAWRADIQAGLASLLVTDAAPSVHALNARARAERLLEGDTQPSREVTLAGGARASTGDLIITRQNDRRLRSLRGGWVRNGDRWQVSDVRRNGALVVRRADTRWGGIVTLPPDYVREHVDLGYTVTAYRAQGITTDTSHVVVSASTTRENLYVSMTRGREANIAYVALDKPDDSHATPHPDDVNARTVLYGVLQHSGVELSAHQMIQAEQEHWSFIAQIAAEYETIAAAAQRDRWIALVENCGLTVEQVELALASDSFGPLTAELRRAEANHHDVDRLLPTLVVRRSLVDAENIGAVLISRLRKAAQPARGKHRVPPNLIAGLIPVANGPMSPEMVTALSERQALIESRAVALARKAVDVHEPWLKHLGAPPSRGSARHRWLREVRTVAAYRDRYQMDGRSALGEPRTSVQKLDAARAEQAIRRARALAKEAASEDVRSPVLKSRGQAIG